MSEFENVLPNNGSLDERLAVSVDPIDIPFAAGEKATSTDGEELDSSSFSFVQQDKKIHDTKFVTRPTTFLKDAFRRFRKSKSSVVGGII